KRIPDTDQGDGQGVRPRTKYPRLALLPRSQTEGAPSALPVPNMSSPFPLLPLQFLLFPCLMLRSLSLFHALCFLHLTSPSLDSSGRTSCPFHYMAPSL